VVVGLWEFRFGVAAEASAAIATVIAIIRR
jgi:hypothetical protein